MGDQLGEPGRGTAGGVGPTQGTLSPFAGVGGIPRELASTVRGSDDRRRGHRHGAVEKLDRVSAAGGTEWDRFVLRGAGELAGDESQFLLQQPQPTPV